MKVNREKLELAMARACMNAADVTKAAGIPRATFNNAIARRSIRPATLGKIATALGADVADIIQATKEGV